MPDIREYCLTAQALNVDVDLAGTAATETILYRPPTGYDFYPMAVVLHTFSADEHATPPIVTLGVGGGDCDEFLGDQTLSNITASYANEAIILQPVPAATPVVIQKVPDGSAFSIEITQANGAALTCKADVFGYNKEA